MAHRTSYRIVANKFERDQPEHISEIHEEY